MKRPTDWCIHVALWATACLLAMLVVGLAAGVSQETFEVVRPPSLVAADLRAHAGGVRALFAIDGAFIVLYSAFFLLFAQRLATAENRPMLALAIAAVVLTALLDMVEDHHILAMLRSAELNRDPSWGQIQLQHTVSSVKFNLSYLALFLFGLCVPRATRVGVALALLLTVGTLLEGIWLYAAPPALLPSGNLGRLLGFVAGFALAIAVLRAHPPRPALNSAT